jgi:hypothetical protein
MDAGNGSSTSRTKKNDMHEQGIQSLVHFGEVGSERHPIE